MEAAERMNRRRRRILTSSLLFASLVLSQNLSLVSAFLPSPSPSSPNFVAVRGLRLPHGTQSDALMPQPRNHSSESFTTVLHSTAQKATKRGAIYISTLPSRQRRKLGNKWQRMIADLTAFREENGHSLVTVKDVEQDGKWTELYRWTRSVRKNYGHQVLESRPKRTATSNSNTTRHKFPREKLVQLEKLDFCWDLQTLSWERRYNQLVQFYKEHGHSRVPANDPNGLGVFVRNCRREYRRFEQGEPSTLTVDRLHKLFAVDFVWSRSREESWENRYRQLQEFYAEHGHSNVPEHYPDNPSLGKWCSNQRTYYSRRCRGEMSSLTEERIQLLEDLGFVWHYWRYKFDVMLNRLSTFYREHGHIRIPTRDTQNEDLRYWITIQRYYYHHRQRDLESDGVSSVPLTEERIRAIESTIPDFSWRARGGRGGPSSQDWAKLFDEMRKKGLRPDAPMKQHWFDGVNLNAITVKDTWTDEDLMALWNSEDDDDDDDDYEER
uniref:Helicase-associated domain-containing protein n=1 Tax=Amphora coffeiformis TaxID=265554 RepID=A0A7S3LBB6_9STRA|eukprot:scaffold5317_cov160-Amphora_coffeaeformis.AAC.9